MEGVSVAKLAGEEDESTIVGTGTRQMYLAIIRGSDASVYLTFGIGGVN